MKSILPILKKAKQASLEINNSSHIQRKKILNDISKGLIDNQREILRANAKDLAFFDVDNPLRDRLLLNKERIKGMASELRSLVNLPDPIGEIFDCRKRSGLKICRKRVPLGVVAVVYESRPNVTTDVAGICLKSGNAAILKGGKEAKNSYQVLVRIIQSALKKNNLDPNAVQMIDPTNRSLVKELITADQYVDLIIPRGSAGLINFVRTNSTVPTIETGAGVCHTFIDATANLKKSVKVVFNAKTQRVSVCNALDTALIHKKIVSKFLSMMAKKLLEKEVEIFADESSYKILSKIYPKKLIKKAKKSDFGREFLSQKMSVKIVSGINEAIEHISTYSSKHSEAILTGSEKNKNKFLELVDAAVIYVNASTRFSDGAVFGLGAEIGISTQKMHARGPMGAAEITTYKWVVEGNYSIRS